MKKTIPQHQMHQPKEVLLAYIEYVEAKTELNDPAMFFTQWAEWELDQQSPISKQILTQH